METGSEIARRFDLWRTMSAEDIDDVEPGRLRDLGIYGGAQGIWVDKARTSSPDGASDGITVSVLHTGHHYADDLSEDGVIYHYPKTNRSASRDAGEVQATKNARIFRVPIFVILPSRKSASKRALRLGWVTDFDDDGRMFLILFNDGGDLTLPPPYVDIEATNEPFRLEEENSHRRQTSVLARIGQQRFRFQVLKKYGPKCAVCDTSHPQLLKAAHIRSKAQHGSDDWRNGIVLCSTHHDAFDAFLFGIEPQSLALKINPKVDAKQIGIQLGSLQLLRNRPHDEALKWRWNETIKEWT